MFLVMVMVIRVVMSKWIFENMPIITYPQTAACRELPCVAPGIVLSSDVCAHGLNVVVIARGTAGGREPVVLFFAIDSVIGYPRRR